MLHYWRFCASSFTLLAPCSTLAAASFFVSSAFDEPQPSHELPFSLAFSTVSSAVFCRESGAGQAKWGSETKNGGGEPWWHRTPTLLQLSPFRTGQQRHPFPAHTSSMHRLLPLHISAQPGPLKRHISQLRRPVGAISTDVTRNRV